MAHWKSISGGLSAIAVGSRTVVWGVNSSSQAYHHTSHDPNPWTGISGGLADIGAGADGTVWGVDSGGGVFRCTGDAPN